MGLMYNHQDQNLTMWSQEQRKQEEKEGGVCKQNELHIGRGEKSLGFIPAGKSSIDSFPSVISQLGLPKQYTTEWVS